MMHIRIKKTAKFAIAALASTTLTLSSAFAGNWNVPLKARDILNPLTVTKANLADGAKIYTKYCTSCHGEDGSGQGTEKSVDYSLQSILTVLSQPGNQPLGDGELYWKITHGIGKMPAFAGVLTDHERWLMVNHIRALPTLK